MKDNRYAICAYAKDRYGVVGHDNKNAFYMEEHRHELETESGFMNNFTNKLHQAELFHTKHQAERKIKRLNIMNAGARVVSLKKALKLRQTSEEPEHYAILNDNQLAEVKAGDHELKALVHEKKYLNAIKRYLICIKDKSGCFWYFLSSEVYYADLEFLNRSKDLPDGHHPFTTDAKRASRFDNKKDAHATMRQLNIKSSKPFITTLKKAVIEHERVLFVPAAQGE